MVGPRCVLKEMTPANPWALLPNKSWRSRTVMTHSHQARSHAQLVDRVALRHTVEVVLCRGEERGEEGTPRGTDEATQGIP